MPPLKPCRDVNTQMSRDFIPMMITSFWSSGDVGRLSIHPYVLTSRVRLWCLTPLLTICQLYRGDQIFMEETGILEENHPWWSFISNVHCDNSRNVQWRLSVNITTTWFEYSNLVSSWVSAWWNTWPHDAKEVNGSWNYNYLCNYFQSPQKLWVRIPLMPRCTWPNIMWDWGLPHFLSTRFLNQRYLQQDSYDDDTSL
jgi:hypothetical protein